MARAQDGSRQRRAWELAKGIRLVFAGSDPGTSEPERRCAQGGTGRGCVLSRPLLTPLEDAMTIDLIVLAVAVVSVVAYTLATWADLGE